MTSDPFSSATAPLLAIIVPAYKTKFLRAALDSIASQTEKNFRLYVFDDASREPVADMVREFSGRLPLKFHRFDKNLGEVSLVRQWERCLRLTTEPWIWIFADDDVMDAGCVADFYTELARTSSAHELYRFNTIWIDAAGAKILENPPYPASESGADFLLAQLGRSRNATLQEIIFSRRGWESAGGIPDFPLGWHADQAFTASLGVRQPLRAIPGARVNWRSSGLNISTAASFAVTNRKIIATTKYMRWVVNFFQAHAAPQTGAAIQISESWMMNYLNTRWNFLGPGTCFALDRLAREVWQRPRGRGFFTGLQVNLNLFVQKVKGRLGARK